MRASATSGLLVAAALLAATPAAAQATKTVTGNIIADNFWGVYTGDASAQNVTAHASGQPANFCGPAAAINLTTTDSTIYVVGYSDNSTAQGLLHDLTVGGADIFSGWTGWEVCPTGDDRNTLAQMPTVAEMQTWIQTCNQQALWVPPVVGGANDGTAGYTWWCSGNPITTVDPVARWTWHERRDAGGNSVCPGPDSPFEPGCNHAEFLIFRRLLPDPPDADAPCPPPTDLVETLNTGLDESGGNLIPVGLGDDDWALVSAPALAPPPQPATVITPQAGWATHPSAQWVGPGPTSDPLDTATYRRCFCLHDAFTYAEVNLHLAANASGEVFLNGNALGTFGPLAAVAFNVDSNGSPALFQTGQNCIEVVTTGGAEFLAAGNVLADSGRCCECAVAPADMIAWWPLDETTVNPQLDACAPGTFADDIAHHPNGPFDGEHRFVDCSVCSPDCQGTALHDVPAVVGPGIQFDGINDQVRAAAAEDLAFNDSGGQPLAGFTIDAWFQRGLRLRLGCDDAAAGWRLSTELPDEIRFRMRDQSGNSLTCSATGVNWNDGQWHMAAVAVSRTTNWLQIYFDGQPQATTGTCDPTTVPGSLHPGGGALNYLYMGGYEGCNATPDDFYGFLLDEVELFGKTLPTADIQRIFNAGSGGKCKEDCFLPTVRFCHDDTQRSFFAQICNDTGADHVYSYTITGPVAGPGCTTGFGPFVFAPSTGAVFVASGACETIPVTVSNLPATLPLGQAACFEMTATNLDTGDERTCTGELKRRHPFKCIKVIDMDPYPIGPLGTVRRMAFEVYNVDDPSGALVYEIDAGPVAGEPEEVVSLDGLPPGENPVGSITVPAGESRLVHVDVEFVEHRPRRFQKIEFLGDQDGDGIPDVSGSVGVRSTAGEPAEFAPGPVPGLEVGRELIVWMHRSAASVDHDPATHGYELVRGDLHLLRSTGGDFERSGAECLASGRESAVYRDTDTCGPGEAFYFLVRGANAAGAGTYDDPAPSQEGSRDDGLGDACP